ncbi:hypothetical protein PoB_006299000 [Plakobranchus ocellatus]|uniref:Uncharacterized protein n=1 Tax=Plakobranchus ocellatus TaxID=259542 RepID=A0AAV4CXI0_9GAST|nr:hypothetical protein PoB_006299000 [Plakobranchus ocellatus]
MLFVVRGVGGTVDSEFALRSEGIPLSRARAPPPTPWPDRRPESLRSPCCGLAIYKSNKGCSSDERREKRNVGLTWRNLARLSSIAHADSSMTRGQETTSRQSLDYSQVSPIASRYLVLTVCPLSGQI